MCDALLERMRVEAGLEYLSDLRVPAYRERVAAALWAIVQRDGLPSFIEWSYLFTYLMKDREESL